MTSKDTCIAFPSYSPRGSSAVVGFHGFRETHNHVWRKIWKSTQLWLVAVWLSECFSFHVVLNSYHIITLYTYLCSFIYGLRFGCSSNILKPFSLTFLMETRIHVLLHYDFPTHVYFSSSLLSPEIVDLRTVEMNQLFRDLITILKF